MINMSKFNVGDKVRVVEIRNGHYFTLNDIVTIEEVRVGGYKCKKDNKEWLVMESEIELVESAKPEINYWNNICEINSRQETKGKSKYGQILEENTTLSTVQRIEHLQEELIDGLKYCEHLKQTASDTMTANDYQRMAMRTAGKYKSEYDKLRNAAYGLNGEAGEVIDILKKHEFQGHELDKDKLIDELGDVQWYIALAATALGVTLQDIMQHNVDKLVKRYPDGFDKARSINREENKPALAKSETVQEETFLSDFLKKNPDCPLNCFGYPVARCPHVYGYCSTKDCEKYCWYDMDRDRDCFACWSQPLKDGVGNDIN